MTTAQPRIVFLDAATYGDISLRSFTDRWQCTVHQLTRPRKQSGDSQVMLLPSRIKSPWIAPC